MPDTKDFRRNEIVPEIGSVQSLNRFYPQNAPARCCMFGGHFSARPVIDGSEPKPIQTGVEEEFGRFTFSVKMPEDGTVIARIPKYNQGLGVDVNPENLVIYQSHDTGEYGCFTIPYYCSHDPIFGFKYELKNENSLIYPGSTIPGGTIFADTPAVKGESHYTYSKNLNVCYMSHLNVGLDGYVISRDALPHFTFRIYEKRSFEFGSSFLLNLYGDDENYKGFPDIGDYVREDGLLAVIRKYNPNMAPSMTSINDVRRPDFHFDEPIYARPGVGRVVDITVIESCNSQKKLPDAMTDQAKRYHSAHMAYYKEIINFHDNIIRRDPNAKVSPELNYAINYALAVTNHLGYSQASRTNRNSRQQITLKQKSRPIDVWRVELVIEYVITPNRGYKLTCENGGKGVICRIEEPENMPVDSDGNRVDIITGPDSVPGRMNLGRLHSPYFAAAARDVRKAMLETIGYDRNFKGCMSLRELGKIPLDSLNKAVDIMLSYYEITSPMSYKEFTEHLTDEEKYTWVLGIFNDMLYTYMPLDDPESLDEKIAKIENKFNLTYGPVEYVGHSGKKVKTTNKVRIAPIPIMLLDKIADSTLVTSIGKHSNFGILSTRVHADKYRRPYTDSPVRVVGETEGRLYVAYAGRLFIAELMDRNGNIAAQREVARNLLAAEMPSSVNKLVSRQKIPFGNARPIQIIEQFFLCAGVEPVYVEEVSPQ